MYISLAEAALFLAAAAIAAPLARWLGIGTVLGYLVAGIIIGPFGIGWISSIYEAQAVLHFAEFGVVLLMFLIGLEIRPLRLWSMRHTIVGAGVTQVLVTGFLLAALGPLLGLGVGPSLLVGLALSLSSTAFALQLLEENKELATRHGRLGFSILLLQDLAAMVLIALVPLFAMSSAADPAQAMSLSRVAMIVAVLIGVVLVGRYVLDRVFRLVAQTRVKEAMTASALLVVVVVVLLMDFVGLSASLGAFIAGALLADSAYRHQIEADIKPFEGLLLGLFFTAIGMSLNLKIAWDRFGLILIFLSAFIAAKVIIVDLIGRWQGLGRSASRRLGLTLSQGGEFAFVLFNAGEDARILTPELGNLLDVVVTLSMIATPLLLLAERRFRPTAADTTLAAVFEAPPMRKGHVIVAGFGRFGQIVVRVLRAKRIPFTALDVSAEQIELVRRFGSTAYYGDASRPEILAAAQADKASALVIAIDDVEASMQTAETARRLYPDLAIYARARNRNHAHRLTEVGVEAIRRETLLSALDLTRELLRGIGLSEKDARRTVEVFHAHDQRRLAEDFQFRKDMAAMQKRSRSDLEQLEQLFIADQASESKASGGPV